MAMVELENMDTLKGLGNARFGPGPWVMLTQEMIDAFALATRDYQWIHTDPDRAAKGSCFGNTTIAHGFLVLSMVSAMHRETVAIKNVAIGVNYGLNRVRFPSPVPVNSRIRLYCRTGRMEDMGNGSFKVVWKCEVEVENSQKPACVCELITMMVGSANIIT